MRIKLNRRGPLDKIPAEANPPHLSVGQPIIPGVVRAPINSHHFSFDMPAFLARGVCPARFAFLTETVGLFLSPPCRMVLFRECEISRRALVAAGKAIAVNLQFLRLLRALPSQLC
jgi:hypothetical protein